MLTFREAQGGGGLRHGAGLICRGHLQRWPSFRQARTPQPGRWSAPAYPDRARHLGGNIIGSVGQLYPAPCQLVGAARACACPAMALHHVC